MNRGFPGEIPVELAVDDLDLVPGERPAVFVMPAERLDVQQIPAKDVGADRGPGVLVTHSQAGEPWRALR